MLPPEVTCWRRCCGEVISVAECAKKCVNTGRKCADDGVMATTRYAELRACRVCAAREDMAEKCANSEYETTKCANAGSRLEKCANIDITPGKCAKLNITLGACAHADIELAKCANTGSPSLKCANSVMSTWSKCANSVLSTSSKCANSVLVTSKCANSVLATSKCAKLKMALLLLATCGLLPPPVAAIKLLPVHWNTTNPIFRLDNTDHVYDVSIGDMIDIYCPQYPRGTPQYMIEQHVLYQVTREEYESCRILHEDNRVTRQVLKCTKPFELQKLTIVFREYTPVPNGLEYVRGQDYYYISTSTGRLPGLYNRDGGHCRARNMKMVFKVCCSNEVSNAAGSHRAPYRELYQFRRYGNRRGPRPRVTSSSYRIRGAAQQLRTNSVGGVEVEVDEEEEAIGRYIPLMDMLQSGGGRATCAHRALSAAILTILLTTARLSI